MWQGGFKNENTEIIESLDLRYKKKLRLVATSNFTGCLSDLPYLFV